MAAVHSDNPLHCILLSLRWILQITCFHSSLSPRKGASLELKRTRDGEAIISHSFFILKRFCIEISRFGNGVNLKVFISIFCLKGCEEWFFFGREILKPELKQLNYAVWTYTKPFYVGYMGNLGRLWKHLKWKHQDTHKVGQVLPSAADLRAFSSLIKSTCLISSASSHSTNSYIRQCLDKTGLKKKIACVCWRFSSTTAVCQMPRREILFWKLTFWQLFGNFDN